MPETMPAQDNETTGDVPIDDEMRDDTMADPDFGSMVLSLGAERPGWVSQAGCAMGPLAADEAPRLLVLTPPACGALGASAVSTARRLAEAQAARGGEWLLQLPAASARWRSTSIRALRAASGVVRARGGTADLRGERGLLPAWLSSSRLAIDALEAWRARVGPENYEQLNSLAERDLVLEEAVAEVLADGLGGTERDLGSLPAESHVDVRGPAPGEGLAEAAAAAFAASASVDPSTVFYDALTGLRLDARLVARARAEELQQMANLRVYSCVARARPCAPAAREVGRHQQG